MIEASIIGFLGVVLFIFASLKLRNNPTYRPFKTLRLIGVIIAFMGLIKILMVVFNV